MASITTDRRQGLNSGAAIKVPCVAATTANITLSGEQTIDGVACVTNDRVLVKNQTTGSENGIYIVDTGAWDYARDWDGSYDVTTGTLVLVTSGTTNTESLWRVSTTGAITIGTTSIAFEQDLAYESASVLFIQSGTGAVERTVQSKLRDVVSVKDWGAPGDGSDQTSAFSLAAKNAPAAVNIQGTEATAIARASMVRLFVPAGTYTISSLVDTGGREVTWVLDQGAVVTGYANLNGKIVRDGMRVIDYHHGTNDYACGFTVRSNVDLEGGSEVLGLQTESELATYTDRDSVALYVDNTAPAATVDIATATYSSTTIVPGTPLTAADLKALRVGMIIDTKHATKYSGFITSWASDGTSVTVESWYLAGGPGTPATPANGTGAYVNPFTKIWAHNANVTLSASSHADKMTGFELGILQNKAAYNPTTDTPTSWGFDCVNLGTYVGSVGFNQRGSFYYGFKSADCNQAGYFISNRTVDPAFGFLSEAEHSSGPFAWRPVGVQTFYINNTGSIEMGSVGAAATIFIDFHSGGSDVDYDSRISSAGGTGVAGNGTLSYTATTHAFNNVVRPTADNTKNLGDASFRWAAVYGTTYYTGAGTLLFTSGSGTPEGVVTAPVGSLYQRSDGGFSTTLYTKDSGAGNTGWRPVDSNSVGADNGNAAATLTVGTSATTQPWNTPLTVDRAVTLSTTGAVNGSKFRIVRTAAATGAFNLNVGTGPLKALVAGTWCDVEYNGSAWMLTAYGTL